MKTSIFCGDCPVKTFISFGDCPRSPDIVIIVVVDLRGIRGQREVRHGPRSAQ